MTSDAMGAVPAPGTGSPESPAGRNGAAARTAEAGGHPLEIQMLQRHGAAPNRGAMIDTVYVLERDAAERRWIESALAGQVRALVFLDDAAALRARLPAHAGDCLLCGAEPDAAAALELVRELRRRGEALPVVMIGPHSAFRTAVDVARLAGTDFLQRPVSAQRLRAALRRVTGAAEPH